MKSSTRDWRSALLGSAMAAVILTWIAGRIAGGGASIVGFDGLEEDGVFQFYNALRRIVAGQRAGVDFQLFHGLGLPYLHLPLFVAFGQSLVAAEWIRVSVSAIVYPGAIIVLCRAYTRRWPAAFTLTVIALVGSRYLESLFAPGNSMLSIRAFAPVLVAAAVTIRAERRRVLLTSAALAVSFLLGIEQGVAALLAVTISTVAFARPDERVRSAARLLVTYGVVAAMTVGAMCALVGWEGARATLLYQLRDLPGDQAWYFGVPPNGFLGTWSDFGQIWIPIVAAILSLLIVVAKWRRNRSAPQSRRSAAVVVLLLYGVFSCGSYLGILSSTYQTVVERSLLLTLILEGYAFVWRRTTWRRNVAFTLDRSDVRMLATGLLLVVSATLAIELGRRTRQIAHLANGPALSARLANDLRTTNTTLRALAEGDTLTAHVWSTYAGLFDAGRGSFQPSPDYIIHALGAEARAKYLRNFVAYRPVMVLTELPRTFPYEEWLQTTSWPFYELVLRQYEVATLTSHRMLWRRLPDSAARLPSSRVDVGVPVDGATVVRLPDPSSGDGIVQVVEMTYVATNALRNAPVIGKMPRFFIDVSHARNHIPITLPPHGGRVVFPVYRDHRGGVKLTARVASLFPGASLRIAGVQMREWRLAGADTSLIPPP